MNEERTERLHDPNIQAIAGVVVGILTALPILGIQAALKLVDHYFPHLHWSVRSTLYAGNAFFLVFVGFVILLSFRRKQRNKGVVISKALVFLLIFLLTPIIWFKF